MDTTTIELSQENWRWLNSLKEGPGESFNDVLDRLRGSDVSTSPHRLKTDTPDLPNELDLPGSGDVLEQRRAAIARMYSYLQTEGTAQRDDLLEVVDVDATGYASAASFWSNCIKGKDTLRSLPNVEPPTEGGRTWKYVE